MRLARCGTYCLLIFLCVLSDRALGANWGNALSNMGAGIADFAGKAAIEQLRHEQEMQQIQSQHDLEMQRMQLQHDLDMRQTAPPPPVAQPPAITAAEAYRQGVAAYQQKQYVQATRVDS